MNNFAPVLSSDSISGNTVKNHRGDDLGSVKELMIDTETGDVAYAVLDFGGFLGMGNKYFAVPWKSLTIDTENKCFKLPVEEETLKQAEGFDKDNWPNFADRTFGERIHKTYNATPYWQ